jgi:hypothetical protein
VGRGNRRFPGLLAFAGCDLRVFVLVRAVFLGVSAPLVKNLGCPGCIGLAGCNLRGFVLETPSARQAGEEAETGNLKARGSRSFLGISAAKILRSTDVLVGEVLYSLRRATAGSMRVALSAGK